MRKRRVTATLRTLTLTLLVIAGATACSERNVPSATLSPRAVAQIEAAEGALSRMSPQASPTSRARALLALARVQHTYGVLDQAAQNYDAVLVTSPGNAEALYLRAHVFREAGAAPQAAEIFRRAAERATGAQRTRERGAAHFWSAAMWRESGNSQRALQELLAAAQERPESAAIHVALSRELRDAGRPRQAERALAIAQRTEAGSGPVVLETVAVRRALGDLPGAAQAAENAFGLSTLPLLPDDPVFARLVLLRDTASALRTRGRNLFADGRYDESVDAYTAAVERDSRDASLLADLGAAAFRAGRPDVARDALQRALAMQPTQRSASLAMAALYSSEGDDAAALRLCDALLAVLPADTAALYQQGCARARLGDVADAAASWTALLEIDRKHVDARRLLARALGRLDRFAEALDVLTDSADGAPIESARLLAAAPDDTLRNGARALLLAQRAVSISSDAAALETLAMAYAELGRFEQAAATQRVLTPQVPEHERERVRTRLRTYEARRRCREPWTAQEWLPVPIPPAASTPR